MAVLVAEDGKPILQRERLAWDWPAASCESAQGNWLASSVMQLAVDGFVVEHAVAGAHRGGVLAVEGFERRTPGDAEARREMIVVAVNQSEVGSEAPKGIGVAPGTTTAAWVDVGVQRQVGDVAAEFRWAA